MEMGLHFNAQVSCRPRPRPSIFLTTKDEGGDEPESYQVIVKSEPYPLHFMQIGYLPPSLEGEIGSMAKALQRAGTFSGDIDYLIAQGTSSKIGEETEIDVVKLVTRFRYQACGINATKGHLSKRCRLSFYISLFHSLSYDVQL